MVIISDVMLEQSYICIFKYDADLNGLPQKDSLQTFTELFSSSLTKLEDWIATNRIDAEIVTQLPAVATLVINTDDQGYQKLQTYEPKSFSIFPKLTVCLYL
jgi:hypothetical protein